MQKPDKILYHWSDLDHSYLAESVATIDPRNPNRYVIPARATDIKPPVMKKNETAIFNTDTQEWTIVPDYRNTSIYSIETGEVSIWATVGNIPKGWTTTQRPDETFIWNSTKKKWVMDKEAKKNKKLKIFLAEYNTKKEETIEYNGSFFVPSSELLSIINNALLVYDEPNFPHDFILPDTDNISIKMSRVMLIELSKIIQEHLKNILANYNIKKRNTERA